MDREEFQQRTKAFALRVMKLVDCLPSTGKGQILGDQLLRSATSVAANYRAACRGRSTAEFVSKLGVALEEADESAFWMDLIVQGGLLSARRVEPLLSEAHELTAMLFASQRTARKGKS